MQHPRHPLFATLLLSLALPALAADPEWPAFRGPQRDNKSPDTGLLKEWPADGPRLLWKVADIGKGFSSVTTSKGLIYITGDVGGKLVLFAFDLDGKPQWKVEHGPGCKAGGYEGARGSVTIDGGNLYLLGGGGLLRCFDAKTGAPKWQADAKQFGGKPGGWGYAESPLILGNGVIFKPGGSNCIVALNKATGAPIWTSKGFSAGPEYGSCLSFTHAGTPLLATGTREGVVIVNANNGALVASNSWCKGNTANCPTPVYSDGLLFWANGYGKGGICLQLGPGGKATQAWTTTDMVTHHGGYLVEGGHLYGNNGGGWACLELKTGKVKWNEKAVGKGSLAWADGMLYLFSEKDGQGGLATCSPDGLKLTGKVKVDGSGPSWAHPVVIGGRLYLRYDTNLYCFDVKAK